MNNLDGEFVPAGHFYSAIPSQETRERFLASPAPLLDPMLIAGVDMNLTRQEAHLKDIIRAHDDRIHSENAGPGQRFGFINPMYSFGDALSLHAMLIHSRPKRIIEVGSGYSSACMLDIIDARLYGETVCTFIEPYPETLISLLHQGDRERITIVPTGVQSVDLALFSNLQDGDVLFIDSTHVAKLDSDVNKLYFDILPCLNSGVRIHIHDVFWPFEYPKSWIAERRSWNENYLLHALLIGSKMFSIEFFSDFMFQRHHDELAKSAPLVLRNTGGHIWLRKI